LARGALAMCAMWVGFFFFFFLRGEEKNKINCKHSVMPVFDFMISWFMKVDFQKSPKHSESMWSF